MEWIIIQSLLFYHLSIKIQNSKQVLSNRNKNAQHQTKTFSVLSAEDTNLFQRTSFRTTYTRCACVRDNATGARPTLGFEICNSYDIFEAYVLNLFCVWLLPIRWCSLKCLSWLFSSLHLWSLTWGELPHLCCIQLCIVLKQIFPNCCIIKETSNFTSKKIYHRRSYFHHCRPLLNARSPPMPVRSRHTMFLCSNEHWKVRVIITVYSKSDSSNQI